MNVFHTHSRIVEDYKTYIRSFLNIADPNIRKIVEEELEKGKLWPESGPLPIAKVLNRQSIIVLDLTFTMIIFTKNYLKKGKRHGELPVR